RNRLARDGRRVVVEAHAAEDDLLTVFETRVRMRRIVDARVDNRAREQRCLIRRHGARRCLEVRARSRFGAPYAVAPLDQVEIQLENATLGQLGFESSRDEELFELAQGIA